MDLQKMAEKNEIKKTGATKKLSISGQPCNQYDVFSIPLDYLYYNDQNGRINTTYKQYQAEHGVLVPEAGNSEYNKIFEKFIYESNSKALIATLQSIKSKTQQEPGVVLPDGRVIDGNRRFTALRMYQNNEGINKNFEAIIVPLNAGEKADEKAIKELELDLQLGHESPVDYNPIDRIFDVYNTIEVEKLMTVEEYKRASGVGNAKGINRDIRLAKLIIRFIKLVSPGGNPIDKFYLARDLKLDGPIEEIESTLNKLKSKNKQSIIDAVLVNIAVSRTDKNDQDVTRNVRELKTNVLNNPEMLSHYLDAVDDKIDTIIDEFEDNPIKSSNDIKVMINDNNNLKDVVGKLKKSTDRLVYKGKNDTKRRKVLDILTNIEDMLSEISISDFDELTRNEEEESKEVIRRIRDNVYKLITKLKQR